MKKFVILDESLAVGLYSASPTILEKAKNVVSAGVDWVKAGMPLASEKEQARRKSICDACELWNAKGNLGLGECTAPGCGCTKAKLVLATSKCTHPSGSRW